MSSSLDWIAAPICGAAALVGISVWARFYFYRWRVGATLTDFGDRRRALIEPWETANGWNMHPAYCIAQQEYCRPNPADGRVIYTQSMIPRDVAPKGVVLYVHGFNDHSGGLKRRYMHFLVQQGYAVHAFDLYGHGRSDGLHVHVPTFDIMLDDTRFIIDRIRRQYGIVDHDGSTTATASATAPASTTAATTSSSSSSSSSRTPRVFLFGESMGGAIVYLFAKRYPQLIDGVIFLSPMLQIAQHIQPPAFVVSVLVRLAAWFPTYPVTPTKDILVYVFKRKELLKLALTSPIYFDRLPRLETALRALRATQEITASFDEFDRPFLTLHGDSDRVTDPNGSINLHKRACVADKTIKLYPGAWHSLLLGEEDATIAQVQRDIVEWLDARV